MFFWRKLTKRELKNTIFFSSQNKVLLSVNWWVNQWQGQFVFDLIKNAQAIIIITNDPPPSTFLCCYKILLELDIIFYFKISSEKIDISIYEHNKRQRQIRYNERNTISRGTDQHQKLLNPFSFASSSSWQAHPSSGRPPPPPALPCPPQWQTGHQGRRHPLTKK